MVVGFVSFVLAGAFRAALLSCRALWALGMQAGRQRALVACLAGGAVLLGQQKGGSIEPPIVGRFCLAVGRWRPASSLVGDSSIVPAADDSALVAVSYIMVCDC